MSIIEAIIYGLIQGITEFLPVSSSGHLSLAQNFFSATNMEESNLTFTVLLHLGTLAAVVTVYYKDIWEMIKGFFTFMGKLFTGKLKQGLDYGEKLFVLVFTATLPLLIAIPFKDKVEILSGMSWVIGILLIINGGILWLADRIGKNSLTIDTSKPINGLLVGFVQMIAIFPGLSRSGSTITGGLLVGFEKQDAVKLSFLMSLPAIAGAYILELFDISENPLPAGSIFPVIIGVLAAVVSGLAAIKLLQYMSKNKKMSVFSLYSIIIGIAAIIADIIIQKVN